MCVFLSFLLTFFCVPSSSRRQVFAPRLKASRALLGLVGAATQRQAAAGFPVLTLLRVHLQGPQSLPVAAVRANERKSSAR